MCYHYSLPVSINFHNGSFTSSYIYHKVFSTKCEHVLFFKKNSRNMPKIIFFFLYLKFWKKEKLIMFQNRKFSFLKLHYFLFSYTLVHQNLFFNKIIYIEIMIVLYDYLGMFLTSLERN